MMITLACMIFTLAADADTNAPVAIKLEGVEQGGFPMLVIHLTHEGEDAGIVRVRFPETIAAVGPGGQEAKYYQDVRSPEWPVKLECEPVTLPVIWKCDDSSASYVMALTNGMILHASARVDGAAVVFQYRLGNGTKTALRDLHVWSCVQFQSAPPFADFLMERTAVAMPDGMRLFRDVVPQFAPYPKEDATRKRFMGYLAGVPQPYASNPFIAPHPGHPDDPSQAITFWSADPPIAAAVIATESQDGAWCAVSTGKGATGVWTNPGLVCHHVDPTVPLWEPGGVAEIETRLDFFKGGFKDVKVGSDGVSISH